MVNVIETGFFLSNAEYFDHYSNQSFVAGRIHSVDIPMSTNISQVYNENGLLHVYMTSKPIKQLYE